MRQPMPISNPSPFFRNRLPQSDGLARPARIATAGSPAHACHTGTAAAPRFESPRRDSPAPPMRQHPEPAATWGLGASAHADQQPHPVFPQPAATRKTAAASRFELPLRVTWHRLQHPVQAAAWGLGASALADPKPHPVFPYRLPQDDGCHTGAWQHKQATAATSGAWQHKRSQLPHVAGLVAADHGGLLGGRCVSWGRGGRAPKPGGRGAVASGCRH